MSRKVKVRVKLAQNTIFDHYSPKIINNRLSVQIVYINNLKLVGHIEFLAHSATLPLILIRDIRLITPVEMSLSY